MWLDSRMAWDLRVVLLDCSGVDSSLTLGQYCWLAAVGFDSRMAWQQCCYRQQCGVTTGWLDISVARLQWGLTAVWRFGQHCWLIVAVWLECRLVIYTVQCRSLIMLLGDLAAKTRGSYSPKFVFSLAAVYEVHCTDHGCCLELGSNLQTKLLFPSWVARQL